MRPVECGEAPTEAGQPKNYPTATSANVDLESRIGKFCSYCERKLHKGSIEIDHVSPKSRNAAGSLEWRNFLLSCKTCNTVKSAKATNYEDFLWPHRDNTFRAFEYSEGGFVGVIPELAADAISHNRATKLLGLVGLDRHLGGGKPRPTS